MKFVPKPVDHSVNAPEPGGLRDFAKLSLSIAAWIAGIYIVLGWSVDISVGFISPQQEHRLAQAIGARLSKLSAVSHPAQPSLQTLLDDLARKGGLAETYVLSIVEGPEPNAMAFPGGRILVTTPLLKAATSENELAMILGHELGHFQHRDHLRRLGRGLLVSVISMVLTGGDKTLGRFIQMGVDQAHGGYSRSQEIAADRYGFELALKRYGHAGGTTDFFQRMAVKEKSWLRWLGPASHPLSVQRAQQLQSRIAEEEIPVNPTVPFHFQ